MKKWIVMILCLALLSGCSSAPRPDTQQTIPAVETLPETVPTSAAGTEPILPPDEETVPVPAIPTVPEISGSQPIYPENPEIHNLEEFRIYLYQQLDAGKRELTLQYYGLPGELTAENIARIGNLIYVQCLPDGNQFHLTLWEYPGQRMVRAYQTGDRSGLNQQETLALDIAIGMVEQARTEAAGTLELERRLFDMLRQKVRYSDASTEIQNPEAPPRHLTALGALLDGSANCQGYVDGLYVLLSIAGFENGKMHVDIPSGGHVVNTVCLDGNWYVVDATFNDYEDPSGVQISYRLLNAGTDKCTEYSWDSIMERNPLCPYTDSNYYYFTSPDGIGRVYGDLDSMARGILDAWQILGVAEHHMMLMDSSASWTSLAEALNREANIRGLQISYDIWVENNRWDTFFYVKLS